MTTSTSGLAPDFAHVDHFFGLLYIIDVINEPLHGLVQIIALFLDGAYGIYCPVSLHILQLQFVGDMLHTHSCDVSLIGEHQHHALLHVGMVDYPLQLLRCHLYSLLVRAVDHKY